MKNVTTFGKLIGPLLFCLPLFFLLSIKMYTQKKTRNELARLGMGTIFLVDEKNFKLYVMSRKSKTF